MGALPHARYNDWVEAFMTHQDLNHRSRAPRIAAIAAGAGVAVAAGAIAGIGAALCSIVFDTAYPNSTFARKRNDRLRHHDPLAQYRDEAGNAWFAQSGQPVSLRTHDGLTLRGWRFDPDPPPIAMRSACTAIRANRRRWHRGRTITRAAASR